MAGLPESDVRNGVAATECDILAPELLSIVSMSYKTYLEDVLVAYTAMAKRHNATRVVAFQPVACQLGTGKGSERARAVIDHFKHDRFHRLQFGG